MREKKFRQAIFLNGKFHSFHYWGFLKNDNNFVSPQCSNQAFNNSQEYTGLKDKNGVEVYEGDVVKYPSLAYNPERDPYILVDVVFSEGEYALRSTGYSLFEMQNELEVIGNIFQNPELLEDSK